MVGAITGELRVKSFRTGRRLRAAAVAATTGAAAALVAVSPAAATVTSTAAPWTPQVVSAKSTVRQLVPCGRLMFAVGRFTTIEQGGHTYTRRNAFSFNARTGAVTSWNPNVHGLVNSIALSPRCDVAYLGGVFDRVHTVKARDIAAVDAGTGRLLRRFGHSTSGAVQTLSLVKRGRHLLVGGAFTRINGRAGRYFVSLDPRTGKLTRYAHLRITGKLPPRSVRRMVYNQQLSPSGKRLLIEGSFTHINGDLRLQMAELNLGPRHVTLNRWHNYKLNHSYCTRTNQFYVRAATFSPDEKTIYLATSGTQGSSPYCDAAVAFTNTPAAKVKWINKTGGDSLYSVAATARNVYVGGHERWANNPYGLNSCGPGCVSRPGIGLIKAGTGKAGAWNPTRSRGHGADDLVITAAGLWVASDNFFDATQCAGAYHPGICFLPGRA